MARVFGTASKANMQGVHPAMIRVLTRALPLSDYDFSVIEGVRTYQRQCELYGQGRTADQLRKVGVDPSLARPGEGQVTWTLNSKHFKNPVTGYGHAVDLVPYPVDWNTASKFAAIALAMFRAASAENVALRYGGDWDRDGNWYEKGETDTGHFELFPPFPAK